MIDGLECCHCGIECGCESHVIVDEHDDPPSAGVSTDADAIDVGQPQCDGSCGEGRPSDRDPRDDPREGDELLDCAGSRRLLVDMVTDAHVYVRVTDGAGGLLGAVRVERGLWKAACMGSGPAPP